MNGQSSIRYRNRTMCVRISKIISHRKHKYTIEAIKLKKVWSINLYASSGDIGTYHTIRYVSTKKYQYTYKYIVHTTPTCYMRSSINIREMTRVDTYEYDTFELNRWAIINYELISHSSNHHPIAYDKLVCIVKSFYDQRTRTTNVLRYRVLSYTFSMVAGR